MTLDPRIAPQYRTDEPPQSEDSDIQQDANDDDLKQNEGYRSICRE